MTDPRKFKAPFNPKERIWQEADRLRAAHAAGSSLPVQVLDLAEFDLGLDLVPVDGLREQLDIDALLMGDLRSILLDKRAFMSPCLEYRLRFSVAHEIGHLILHRDIYAGLKHATAREWFDYISAIPEVEYGWVEWQAYEFAGRLLVPPEPLRKAFEAAIQFRAKRWLFRLAQC
ncbi:MAG TPA: ImmA/IrrE family metallo-endopeptidase [Candidatus Saccharimonadales bacterium]|nr:ImmA/IrrE family metallo-endopeptidase [Candidatus Saccharimonadales bacterium]